MSVFVYIMDLRSSTAGMADNWHHITYLPTIVSANIVLKIFSLAIPDPYHWE